MNATKLYESSLFQNFPWIVLIRYSEFARSSSMDYLETWEARRLTKLPYCVWKTREIWMALRVTRRHTSVGDFVKNSQCRRIFHRCLFIRVLCGCAESEADFQGLCFIVYPQFRFIFLMYWRCKSWKLTWY